MSAANWGDPELTLGGVSGAGGAGGAGHTSGRHVYGHLPQDQAAVQARVTTVTIDLGTITGSSRWTSGTHGVARGAGTRGASTTWAWWPETTLLGTLTLLVLAVMFKRHDWLSGVRSSLLRLRRWRP